MLVENGFDFLKFLLRLATTVSDNVACHFVPLWRLDESFPWFCVLDPGSLILVFPIIPAASSMGGKSGDRCMGVTRASHSMACSPATGDKRERSGSAYRSVGSDL